MKNIFTYIILLLIGSPIIAQENSPHVFSFHGGAGLSTLLYTPANGEYTPGIGGNLGIGYRYMLNSSWGVGAGVGLDFYGAKTSYATLSDSYNTNDLMEGDITYKYTLTDFEEQQHATLLSIPLHVYFQTRSKRIFYVQAGGWIGIPLSGTFSQTASSMNTAIYIPYEGGEGTPHQGMQSYMASGDIDLKWSVALSIEGGMAWHLGSKFSLYTGLYLDYGLTDMRNSTNVPVLAYPKVASRGFELTTAIPGSIVNAPQSGKLQSLSCGLRLSLSLWP